MHPIFSSLNIQNIVCNWQNVSPWNVLVIKAVVIVSVGQYLIVTFLFLTWSVMEKCLMFKCLVFFLELFLPFSCSTIILLSYWYKLFYLGLYSCASRKILVHNIRLDASSTPTNSASVLIFLFSFLVTYIRFVFFPLLMLLLYAI